MLCKICWILLAAVSIVPYNVSVGPSPIIKASFFLLSTGKEDFISAPKIMAFLPEPSVWNEKVPFISDPIPYPDCLHLSISAVFTNLTILI